MEFEFTVDELLPRVDALIMKDLQFKRDCNKNIKLLNEKIENYNKEVSSYNEWIIDKAEAQLEGVSDHKLILDLTEIKQKSRRVESFFGYKEKFYKQRNLKGYEEIQKSIPYTKNIYVEKEVHYNYCYLTGSNSYRVRSFKYNTKYYDYFGEECYDDIKVFLYIYLEEGIFPKREELLISNTKLQSLKDKLLLAKKYDVENITLGEKDLETLTFYENIVYKDDTPCWDDMHKNEEVLKFIEENTDGK